jgi:DNA-binding MarR family transcriptional regulator
MFDLTVARTKNSADVEVAAKVLATLPLLLKEIRANMSVDERAGLTMPQFRCLAALASGPKSNKEIAQIIGCNVATMSRMIQKLVDRGLLEKTTRVADRREVRVRLARKGQTAMANSEEKVRLHLASILTGLNRTEKREIAMAFESLNRLLTLPQMKNVAGL